MAVLVRVLRFTPCDGRFAAFGPRQIDEREVRP